MFDRQRIRITEFQLTEQYRFPRAKKKRIRKKWAKLDKNYRSSNKIFQLASSIACSQVMASILREFERHEQRQAKERFTDQLVVQATSAAPAQTLTADMLNTLVEQVRQKDWLKPIFEPARFEPPPITQAEWKTDFRFSGIGAGLGITSTKLV